MIDELDALARMKICHPSNCVGMSRVHFLPGRACQFTPETEVLAALMQLK
ncbi:hypothetical protein [Klebsiella pneumoniae]|nr:hypothetical protein [Klebsiella pneumoniae]